MSLIELKKRKLRQKREYKPTLLFVCLNRKTSNNWKRKSPKKSLNYASWYTFTLNFFCYIKTPNYAHYDGCILNFLVTEFVSMWHIYPLVNILLDDFSVKIMLLFHLSHVGTMSMLFAFLASMCVDFYSGGQMRYTITSLGF